MAKYVDILLTNDGMFCAAPPWTVKVGDLVCLPDVLTGESKLHEVIATTTNEENGDYTKMIEKYIGYPLPRVKTKYFRSEVMWEGENVHE